MANNVNISLILRTNGFIKGLANAKQQLTTFGQVSSTVGRTLQYALGGALIAVGADAAKAAADFDLANRKLKALAGPEAAASVAGLADTARLLGKNSIFTAAEVANLQLELKKLGLTSRDVNELSKVTVKFATAMDTDAATAGATLVKTLNKFKSSFEEYESKAEAATVLSERMANAVLNSALTFETLQSSLGYAGGEAEAAGFSFSETTAILAKLADAGFEGSRAGTILRRIFINLAKTGAVDLKEAFGDLVENQQQFAELIKITGARSAGGIASIQGLKDAIAEFAEANENASGQVEGLYQAVDQSLIGRIKNLRSAIQELGIVFEKQFGRQLRDIISGLASWIRSIDAADAKAVGAIVGFTLLMKTLKGLRAVVGNLALAFVGKGGIGGLAKSLLRFSPTSIMVTAFAAGFVIMKNSMNDLKNKALEATGAINDMFTAFTAATSLEDPFTQKVKDRAFATEKEYRDAANDRLQNLAIALERGRKSLKTEFAKYTTKVQADVEGALRSGLSPGEIVSLYKDANKDRFFTGEGSEKFENEVKDYTRFVNTLASTLANEKVLIELRQQLLAAGKTKETTYWKDAADEAEEAAKAIRDVIQIFEDANLDKLDKNGDGAVKTYKELTAALEEVKKQQRELNAEEAETLGRGQLVSDDLNQRLDDNKLLLNYYRTQLALLDNQKKATRDVIAIFEKSNASTLDRNGDSFINTYRELNAAVSQLKDEQRALNKEEAETVGRGKEASENLLQRISDNKILLDYYSAQLAIIEAQNTKEEQIADNTVRRTGLQQRAYEWMQKQKEKQEEIQKRIAQENKEIAAMVGLGQTLVDVFKRVGFTVRESITLANGLLLGMINALNDAFSSFAQTFATALVDPAKKMGEAMRDWGKQLLITLVAAIVKIGLLTGAIALGNKLTGGGVTALLKVLAANGQQFGGGLKLANTLAGGGDLSAATKSSFTGYISGSDLVLGTSRGINARDRIYG